LRVLGLRPSIKIPISIAIAWSYAESEFKDRRVLSAEDKHGIAFFCPQCTPLVQAFLFL
jgi:hypothetical protein